MSTTMNSTNQNLTSSTNASSPGICDNSKLILQYNCILLEHAPAAVYADRFVTPFWYLFGIIGNSIVFWVWSKRYQRRANISSLYLAILAVTDNLLLLTHVVSELHYAWGISTLDINGICSLYFVLFMALQYASPLLILGFTIERFISITRPFRSEQFSRNKRGPIEICVLSLVAISLGVPQYFGWEVSDKGNCGGTNSDFYRVWSWVSDILVFAVFPVMTIFLNVLVLRAAVQSVKFRRQPVPSYYSACPTSSHKSKPHLALVSPSTATLLTVSFYRLFTLIPVAIIFALQFNYPAGKSEMPVGDMGKDYTWIQHFKWFIAKKIIDEVGLSQYCCNFIIYLVTAKPFRKELEICFCCFKKTAKHLQLGLTHSMVTSHATVLDSPRRERSVKSTVDNNISVSY